MLAPPELGQGFVATARELPLSPNEIRRCEARTWSPRGRASEAEAPAGATPEGWAGLLRAGFGHPTREGLAFATRLFAQMETFEAYGYAERHPDVARLIPRGTPFRVIARTSSMPCV